MEVVLGEMNSAEQAQALQRGQIDLGFVHWGRLPAEIVSEPFISDPFLCCLPAGHRLAGQARLTSPNCATKTSSSSRAMSPRTTTT